MSFTDVFESDILKLWFNGTAIANIADNAAASPLTNLYLSLHTADPGETGSQTTSEAAYTSYARVAVARSTSGFTVSGTTIVSLVAAASFPASTGGNETLLWFGIGTSASGAGKLLARGVLGSNLGAFTAATNGNITIPGLTGLAVDDRVLAVAPTVGSLPTGLTAGTLYFVKSVAGDVLTLATASGGPVVTFTTTGLGALRRVTPITIASSGPSVTPQIAAGTIASLD